MGHGGRRQGRHEDTLLGESSPPTRASTPHATNGTHPHSDVVHHDNAVCPPVICASDGPKPLLPSRVPLKERGKGVRRCRCSTQVPNCEKWCFLSPTVAGNDTARRHVPHATHDLQLHRLVSNLHRAEALQGVGEAALRSRNKEDPTSPPVLLTKSTPMVLINDSVNSSSCTAVRVGVSGARASALRLERTHRKPQQQATLSNARVPDEDELEKVVIVALCLQGSGEAHRRRVRVRPPRARCSLRRLRQLRAPHARTRVATRHACHATRTRSARATNASRLLRATAVGHATLPGSPS